VRIMQWLVPLPTPSSAKDDLLSPKGRSQLGERRLSMLAPLSLRLSASRKPAREISPCSALSAGQKSHGHWQSQCYLCAGAIHIISPAVPAVACRQTRFHHSPWGVKWEVEQRVSLGGEPRGTYESLIIVNATSGWL
jgi:hypothetical protein